MRRKSVEMSAHIRSVAVFVAGVLIGRLSRRRTVTPPQDTLQRSVMTTAAALKLAEEQRHDAENHR